MVVDEKNEKTTAPKSETSKAYTNGKPTYGQKYYNRSERHERHETGHVISKDRDTITVKTNVNGVIILERDQTHITFAPELGDYVTLFCGLPGSALDDRKGHVLNIRAVKPLRMMSGIGKVMVGSGNIGEIDDDELKDELYYNASLVANFNPKDGDIVQYQAVENGYVSRRCISVKLAVPSVQCKNGKTASAQKKIPSELLKCKPAALNSQRKNAFFAPTMLKTIATIAIPEYDVPSELFKLVSDTKDVLVIKNCLYAPPYSLKDQLTPANYYQQFHTFLYLEEIQEQIEFTGSKYNRENAKFACHKEFLTLSLAGLHKSGNSLPVGTMAYANRTGYKDTAFQGSIKKIEQDKVYLLFDRKFHDNYKGETYQVRFVLDEGMKEVFRRQHHALEKIVQVMGPGYLFPQRIKFNEPKLDVHLNEREELVLKLGYGKRILPWCNAKLNVYQKAAIANVLRAEARPFPYIIVGPPGTGKTITIIELISQLVINIPDCRLIVATPSNSAAYLITDRLVRTGLLPPGELIRLVSNSQVTQRRIPPNLTDYCATVSIRYLKKKAGKKITITQRELQEAEFVGYNRVTISTCCSIGTLLKLKFPSNHFTHIIIDEAGMCLEPESLIPICLSNRTYGTVVLVGDPQQLGAVTTNRYATPLHLKTSLLERLLESIPMYAEDKLRFPETGGYDSRLVSMLRINYRSIPSVLSLYNELFYGGKLIPFLSEHNESQLKLLSILHLHLDVKRGTPDCGVFFHAVDGLNSRSDGSTSWYNLEEAKTVCWLVLKLLVKGYKPQDIGVITPYKLQIHHIQRRFQLVQLDDAPEVGTVELFQGQERNVMIMSTVRSPSSWSVQNKQQALGFVADEKRINVAISRAKVALIIVGNPKLLSLDPIWKQIIDRAIKNETYTGSAFGATATL
ncbi:probable RNA helicase armi [Anopheles bellator]|uniref:probable RNA helicase armi n=1 Tax=Anopheles bellator TaxID=139047 RepID=UPI00264768F3|nr:probable RNA helicase armi [Anopheles bellator]